jgi:hypothetical protein
VADRRCFLFAVEVSRKGEERDSARFAMSNVTNRSPAAHQGTFDDLLIQIDWKLLHTQKTGLVQLIWDQEDSPLWGIIHLIDCLQDRAEQIGLWVHPGEQRSDHSRQRARRKHSEKEA